MFKKLQISTLLVSMCLGCDINARQQQAEDARREETIKNLKKIGKEMHEKQNDQPLPEGDTKEGP